jgi:hypothetical protein
MWHASIGAQHSQSKFAKQVKDALLFIDAMAHCAAPAMQNFSVDHSQLWKVITGEVLEVDDK